MISISKPQINKLIKRLDSDRLQNNVDDALYLTSLESGNIFASSIQKDVYNANKPVPTYRRTGAALRGREVKKISDGYKLVGNSTLGGAEKNYTPFLNKNSRIAKFNTLFFERTRRGTYEYMKFIFSKKVKI